MGWAVEIAGGNRRIIVIAKELSIFIISLLFSDNR